MAKATVNKPEPETKYIISKEEAQAIIKKYDGINGVEPTEELKEARAVLRGNVK